MTGSSSPKAAELRAYQVGFGDCFLLSFRYDLPEEDRHLLIDFGSTERPAGAPKRSVMLRRVADDIKDRCGGRLHAVIATHRHADHINGFATTKKQDGPGDVIRSCKPAFVLQPWTEAPDAPADPLTQQFTHRLHALHGFSAVVARDLGRLRSVRGLSPKVLRALRVLAANNAGDAKPANRSAVENLAAIGREGTPFFLSYGQSVDLALPGVQVHVLGPPTLEQSKEILRQRYSYPEEFWQLVRDSSPVVSGEVPLFSAPATPVGQWAPQHARWLIRRLTSLRSEQLLEMVRILDDVLNNTSLILLFTFRDQKLLFPGDAQWENWSYALKQEGTEDLLKGATLYKVGHHGSRNATPRALWGMIQGEQIRSVLSTKPGRHGTAEDNSEVPRASLVKELRRNHKFFSTQDLKWSDSLNDPPPSRVFTFRATSAEPPS
jgi:hypothetical protein